MQRTTSSYPLWFFPSSDVCRAVISSLLRLLAGWDAVAFTRLRPGCSWSFVDRNVFCKSVQCEYLCVTLKCYMGLVHGERLRLSLPGLHRYIMSWMWFATNNFILSTVIFPFFWCLSHCHLIAVEASHTVRCCCIYKASAPVALGRLWIGMNLCFFASRFSMNICV